MSPIEGGGSTPGSDGGTGTTGGGSGGGGGTVITYSAELVTVQTARGVAHQYASGEVVA